ncbi:MBL fold metallo-hydrolase [Salirhabdus sp. Marseille-P4669]|uniref:MBL fold metallo-hydrolase n=1 Tax=Salirhabdus sp. Marseille-P4669 TaxID=2042310 RepID=UPI000C7A33BB|nr:MBL fold metallo-hydrolase [Salirhabdus sp. Marseille-P4669]
MKITVIGYYGAYPEGESATSCYLLEKDGFAVLLDCGSGTLSRLPLYKAVADLDAVVLSHYHHDHVADIGPLQYFHIVQNGIHGTNNILPIYGHQEEEEQFNRLTGKYTVGKSYQEKEPLTLGPFTFTFYKTVHPVPCFAMKITDGQKTCFYTADTSYFDRLSEYCKDVDLLIADCSFYEGMDGSGPGHMTSEECGKVAKAANVKQLWLSHLPHFGEITKLKEEAKKYYDGAISLAIEGLSFP